MKQSSGSDGANAVWREFEVKWLVKHGVSALDPLQGARWNAYRERQEDPLLPVWTPPKGKGAAVVHFARRTFELLAVGTELELDTTVWKRLDRHLELCADCRETLTALRDHISSGKNLEDFWRRDGTELLLGYVQQSSLRFEQVREDEYRLPLEVVFTTPLARFRVKGVLSVADQTARVELVVRGLDSEDPWSSVEGILIQPNSATITFAASRKREATTAELVGVPDMSSEWTASVELRGDQFPPYSELVSHSREPLCGTWGAMPERRAVVEQAEPGKLNLMRLPLIEGTLQLLHLSGVRLLAEGKGWCLYRAKEVRAGGKKADAAVTILDAAATQERMKDVARAIASSTEPVFSDHCARIVVGAGERLTYREETAIRDSLGASSGSSYVDAFGRSELRGRLAESANLQRRKPARAEWYVEPSVLGPDNEIEGALSALTSFLSDTQSGSRVGVVVGEAGVGKSTLAGELSWRLQQKEQRVLLVEDERWRSLVEERGSSGTTLADLLKSVLGLYGVEHDLAALDVLLAQGVVVLIFDAFDELCGRMNLGAAVQELRKLIEIAQVEASNARILVTVRGDVWQLVDEDVRSVFSQFSLQPFDDALIRRYITKRAESSKDSAAYIRRADRALSLLPASELSTSPLVLDELCQRIEQGDEDHQTEAVYEGVPSPAMWVARTVCGREARKLQLPLDATAQIGMFVELWDEFGLEFAESELVLLLDSEYGLGEREAVDFARHAMLVRSDLDGEGGERRYAFRHVSVLESMVAVVTAKSLMTGLDGKECGTVAKRLVRAGSTFSSFVDALAGAIEGLAELDAGLDSTRERIWGLHRKLGSAWQETGDGSPESTLFHSLVRTSVRSAGNRGRIDFVGRSSRGLVVDKVRLYGTLVRVDLRGTVFDGVVFREVDFVECLFDAGSTFCNCTFFNSFFDPACRGLEPGAFSQCAFDAPTRARSGRVLPADKEDRNQMVEWALRRVLARLLKEEREGYVTVFDHEPASRTEIEVMEACVSKGVVVQAGGRKCLRRDLIREAKLMVERSRAHGSIRDVAAALRRNYN